MPDQLFGTTTFTAGLAGLLGLTFVARMLAADARIVATDLPECARLRSSPHIGAIPPFGSGRYVNDDGHVEEIFGTIRADGREPNVVLNNATMTGELLLGTGADFPDLAHTSLDDWNRALETNLTGAFLVARQMAREILGRYPATLINVASMYALNGRHHRIYEGMPFGSFPAYSATKAGIHGLTLWLAGDWAGRQTTVNTFAPGAVYNGHSEEFQRRVGELIMAGRMADPEEIADVMLFLCSTQAGYMTGQLVNVDGGFSAG